MVGVMGAISVWGLDLRCDAHKSAHRHDEEARIKADICTDWHMTANPVTPFACSQAMLGFLGGWKCVSVLGFSHSCLSAPHWQDVLALSRGSVPAIGSSVLNE